MASSFFNSLDYFYIFLVLGSCLIGFFRGFVKDFFSTCAWVGSGFASMFVAPYLAHSMQENGVISNPVFAKIVALTASFIVVLITLLLAINTVSKKVKSTVISGLDRAFGALYGFVRGFVVLIILCLCVIIFNLLDFKREFIVESKITPILLNVTDYLLPKIMSPTIKSKIPLPKKTRDDSFTDAEMREMERLANGPVRGRKNVQSTQEDSSQETRISDYLNDLIARFTSSESASNDSPRVIPSRNRSRIRNKENNVPFGCMDLMKARAKRRAQKKAERIKMDLMKKLDNQP